MMPIAKDRKTGEDCIYPRLIFILSSTLIPHLRKIQNMPYLKKIITLQGHFSLKVINFAYSFGEKSEIAKGI